MNRRTLLSLAGAITLSTSIMATSAFAVTTEGAKALVQSVTSQVISLIQQPGAAQSKAPQLKAIMAQNADMRQVAGAALGRYARGTSPEQRDRYVNAYEDYVARTYADRFSEYGGETISVNGAQDYGSKGVVVDTSVNVNGQVISIKWQVRDDRSGQPKINDIIVEGLSMISSQQAEFTQMIQQMGGDIDAFITRLQTLGA